MSGAIMKTVLCTLRLHGEGDWRGTMVGVEMGGTVYGENSGIKRGSEQIGKEGHSFIYKKPE